MVFGAGLLLLAWLAGSATGVLGILGLSGVVLGVGIGARRLLLRRDELVREAREDLKKESARSHRAHLRQLHRRLRRDRDPRTGQYLAELRRLYDRLQRAGLMGSRAASPVLPEVRTKAEELYRSCVTSMERAVQLWETSQEMATDQAKQQALTSREMLLEEVGKSVRHLGATVDHLQTAGLGRGDEGESLARMREELDQGLEIARRVEQRMAELTRDASGTMRE